MIVLGLQFGHDGSACVIEDGRILSYVYRERETRTKHVIGLTTHEIDLALKRAGIDVAQIDCFGIVSTQNLEILNGLIDDFHIRFFRHKNDAVPSPYADLLRQGGENIESRLSFELQQLFQKPGDGSLQYRVYSALCLEKDSIRNKSLASTGWLDQFVSTEQWNRGASLSEIGRINASSLLEDQAIKYGFHYPVTVSFRGRDIPGYFINHHVAHASSCYFRSGFDEAAILTHDGFSNGIGYHSGLILYGRDNEIIPMNPHHLAVGGLYDAVGMALNLGDIGSAGKLMGLAPYGKPRFFRHDFVGNWYDISRRYKLSHAEAWMRHCSTMTSVSGYDLKALANRDRITESVNADIAASTQKLFEECYLAAVNSTYDMMRASGITTSRLCLSGGTALNCPSNARIFSQSSYSDLFVEPSCGDDGLAIGSALYVYHHLYGNPIVRLDGPSELAFLGYEFAAEEIDVAIKQYAEVVRFERATDTHKLAARDLHENKIIAWYEGGSEAGPRALGHRSILANPRYVENWSRVNRIKQREWWRPFAPSVLVEEAKKWFGGLPAKSPYMLFTGQVLSDQLPAIRHVDGTARIQTVDESVGNYYRVIEQFFALSGIPVVLNTSFNGPGEPIIETPGQAIEFLCGSELDALYLPGYRVVRA